MPANSFRASQLVSHIQALIAQHGDCDVVIIDKNAERVFPITEKDVVGSNGLPGKELPHVVFAIGPRGQIEDYAFTRDGVGTEYSTDLEAAPVETALKVNKRFGGVDDGYKDEAGVWYVYEGSSRAWAVAPGGVLGWRLP